MDHTDGGKLQLTGDRAETKVRALLLDAGIHCSKFEKDRGEDLLVELDGYAPVAPGSIEPRVGVLQIKGHDAESDELPLEDYARRRIKVEKLKRWAAYPMPAFLIAVDMLNGRASFYGESVDKVVSEFAPAGLDSLNQSDITVRIPVRPDLPEFLRESIASFYDAHAFQLVQLSEDVIARNHYELMSTNESQFNAGAIVWMIHLRILWKGPWRPAHFWAMLNHIADSLKTSLGNRTRPLLATIHVYRSLKDSRDNNAIAHMSWLDESHPTADEIRERIEWPKAKHWLRFRFNTPPNLIELPENFVVEQNDSDYLEKIDGLWRGLDGIVDRIFPALNEDFRIPVELLRALRIEYESLDEVWETEIGKPSPQFSVLDKAQLKYLLEVDSALFWLAGKEDVAEIQRQIWLQDHLAMLQGCYRGFALLKSVLAE